MIRRHMRPDKGPERHFRWRAAEVTRLEGFSDAVFAFAVTLLVVSLEVPKTYPELLHAMQGFVSFGVCFALLVNVWYQHSRFFRRYGLQDPLAVALNGALLFCVLFYVYPMKFLFTAAFMPEEGMSEEEARFLFGIFGGGYAAIFTIFCALYWHALRKHVQLELTPLEQLITRHSLIHQAAMVAVGLMSIALAYLLPPSLLGFAGFFYFIILPYFTVSESIFGRRQRQLIEREAQEGELDT
jgi:uncharacterized membrane protein